MWNELSIFVRRSDDLVLDYALNVWLTQVDDSGHATHVVSNPLELKPIEEAVHIAPTFRISLPEAQKLMDRLWECGLRPTEGKGSAGMMAATQQHLADMRAIAFSALSVKAP